MEKRLLQPDWRNTTWAAMAGLGSISLRDEALLITRQRPKGLKVVSYPKFSIDSENPFLGGQSLRVLGEK